MNIHPLFICYPIGARGNFLNAILQDLFDKEQFFDFDLKSYSRDYYKMHCLKHELEFAQQKNIDFLIGREVVTDYSRLFSAIKSQNIYSIRILPRTVNGLIDLAILGLSKNQGQFDEWQLHGMCNHSIEQIEEDLQHRCYYDQIVYFEDLFDTDKINLIYNAATQQWLSDEAIKLIKHNNVLQQNLINDIRSKEKFQKIFPIIEQQFAQKLCM